MRITPLDIRKQEFRKGMRGLDAEEVYAFLSTVADEYESVLNDNKALRERLLELDDKVSEYRTMERTLRDTLITAERVTADAKDNASREANIIIKEAQIQAEKALRDIKNDAMKLRQQVQQLRSQRESYIARMKVVVESHLKFIETAAKEFDGEDNEIQAEIDEVDAGATPGSTPAAPESPAKQAGDLFDAKKSPAVDDATPGPVSEPDPASSDTASSAPKSATGPVPTPARVSTSSPGSGARPENATSEITPSAVSATTTPVAQHVAPAATAVADPAPATESAGADPATDAETDEANAQTGGPEPTPGKTLSNISAILKRLAQARAVDETDVTAESLADAPAEPPQPIQPDKKS